MEALEDRKCLIRLGLICCAAEARVACSLVGLCWHYGLRSNSLTEYAVPVYLKRRSIP